jgi:signal transduction histidine kinase
VLKAYRAIAALEHKERLVNSITAAVRCSLEPAAILSIAALELGRIFANSRCLLYRCQTGDEWVKVEYEAVPPELPALLGESWPLAENPLFQVAAAQERAIAIADVASSPLQNNPNLQVIIQHWRIRAWLLVPIRNQGKLLGMIELHKDKTAAWSENDISLVEAIANQVGVGLTQAHAYADLERLNRQLTTLERTQGNLIAIVGHELRTPLSTIQVFLEGVASEPEMPAEFRQEMLEIARSDTERMRKLIQDFLTLSRLESGQVYGCPEAIPLQETIEIAIGGFQARNATAPFPIIKVELPSELPLVQADAEGLGEALGKLLENACKFTDSNGEIVIQARICDAGAEFDHCLPGQRFTSVWSSRKPDPMLEVIIADTGRGIESDQLETIFNRFYQAEDSLRRTVGGVGLGLAICRQIIVGMGGSIWAESAGKNQGSRFHFTIPIESSQPIQTCVASSR